MTRVGSQRHKKCIYVIHAFLLPLALGGVFKSVIGSAWANFLLSWFLVWITRCTLCPCSSAIEKAPGFHIWEVFGAISLPLKTVTVTSWNVVYLRIQAALKKNIPSIRMQLYHFVLSGVLRVHHHFSFTRLLLTRLFVRPSDLGLLYMVLYRWNCDHLTAIGNLTYCETFTHVGVLYLQTCF
jgi:hypothetical protein